MVSGIDDQLRRLWTRLGQTLRVRVNHRARNLLSYSENLVLTNSTIVRIRQYNRDNNELVELSVLRYKKVRSLCFSGNPDTSSDSSSATGRTGDVYENDSNENDCVRGRDDDGAKPCSAARADDAGGPLQGGR